MRFSGHGRFGGGRCDWSRAGRQLLAQFTGQGPQPNQAMITLLQELMTEKGIPVPQA